MAEGLAKHFLGHQFDIFSAGTHPAPQIDPLAKAVMAENGIDIRKQSPKNISEIDMSKIHLIITLCQEDKCPVFAPELKNQLKIQHWPVADPAESILPGLLRIRRYRKLRDDIKKRVLELRAAQQAWQL